MAILNPVYGLILPFLLTFTIPIAIFAAITTTIAFVVLLFRVALVYIELAFAVIPYYLLGVGPAVTSLRRTESFASPTIVPVPRRKRRGSASSSTLSATGTVTPVANDNPFGLSQSRGAARDFEGVGGWRLDNASDDESLWTNFNSRLELPADHVRRHRRSLTSGSMPGDGRQHRGYSPEATTASPNISKSRTPPTSTTPLAPGDGYFPQLPVSPRATKRTSSIITTAPGSSGSSKGSSVSSLKQR